MAQNITLLGASYSAVPAVTLPKTGGGTAKFTDVTGTTAAASDVANGKIFFDANGTQQTGTASGGSSMNVQAYIGTATRKANSYGATDAKLTVAKAGTYTISWTAWRSSSSGTMGTNLHINSTAEASNHQTFTGTYGQQIELTGISLSQGDVLTVYATSGNTSRTLYVSNLVIVQTS